MEAAKVAQAKKADPAGVAKAGYDALMAGDDHVVRGPDEQDRRQGLRDPAPDRRRRPQPLAERTGGVTRRGAGC